MKRTWWEVKLVPFIEVLKTRRTPLTLEQTIELVSIIIAKIRRREQNGRGFLLEEIRTGLTVSMESALLNMKLHASRSHEHS